MSYEQLEVRLKSLQNESQAVTGELLQLSGAHRELKHLSEQMIPGLDQEILEERSKQMQGRINSLQAKELEIRGSIKETAYWIHQTMHGQEPKEAIDQINKTLGAGVTEGPVTVHDVLTSPDPVFAGIQQERGGDIAETAFASGEPVPVGG